MFVGKVLEITQWRRPKFGTPIRTCPKVARQRNNRINLDHFQHQGIEFNKPANYPERNGTNSTDAMVVKTWVVWTTQITDSYPSRRSWASLQVWESEHIPTNCIQNRWWVKLNLTCVCTETLWQMIRCKIPKILRCIYCLLCTCSASKSESHKALQKLNFILIKNN